VVASKDVFLVSYAPAMSYLFLAISRSPAIMLYKDVVCGGGVREQQHVNLVLR
jgi:hypothetical protein